MAVIGILCGLAAEARTLGRWGRDPRIAVAIAGADARAATLKAELLVAEGARLLISWGMAGGLAPDLAPGNLIIGASVVPEHGSALPLAGPADRWTRPLASATTLVTTPGAKARLRAETGADAVDMETLAAARAAADHGLSATAIRAIADPADRTVPGFLIKAIDNHGKPRPAPLLAGLTRHPRTLGTLWRLRGDSRAALAALAKFAEADMESLLAPYL